MANPVILDSATHRTLAVSTAEHFTSQDGLGSMVIFPSELDAAHKEFPIFIRKHSATGQFFLCALLSCYSTENLFYHHHTWLSRYVPLMARRGPFLMTSSDNSAAPKMCVDLEDARVTSHVTVNTNATLERVFDDQGKPTDFAANMASILHAIHEGHRATPPLLTALAEQRLIEAVTINVPEQRGSCDMLQGLYAINAEKLKHLSGDALGHLNRQGYLQSAYFISSSAANLAPLLANEMHRPLGA